MGSRSRSEKANRRTRFKRGSWQRQPKSASWQARGLESWCLTRGGSSGCCPRRAQRAFANSPTAVIRRHVPGLFYVFDVDSSVPQLDGTRPLQSGEGPGDGLATKADHRRQLLMGIVGGSRKARTYVVTHANPFACTPARSRAYLAAVRRPPRRAEPDTPGEFDVSGLYKGGHVTLPCASDEGTVRSTADAARPSELEKTTALSPRPGREQAGITSRAPRRGPRSRRRSA